MPRKILIALPEAMLEQCDYIAQCEHRTRSDLVREALRRYLDNFKRTQGSHLTVSTIEQPAPFAPVPKVALLQTVEHVESQPLT